MTVTGDYLILFLVFLALGLTAISLKVNLVLFRMAAAVSWLALGILFWTGDVGVGLSSPWSQALGLVLLIMAIAPLTLQMVTEIRTEESGKSWITWGKKPVGEKKSRSQRVYDEHKAKIRAARTKRLR